MRCSAARLQIPDRFALTFADRSWTYADLDAAVDRVASLLGDRGLEPGSRVAAYGVNSDAYLIAFLATSRAGLTHVPVNYALTGGELEYLLTDSGASLVLVDPAQAPTLDAVLENVTAPPRSAARSRRGRGRHASRHRSERRDHEGALPAAPTWHSCLHLGTTSR